MKKRVTHLTALMFLGLGLCTANALAGLQSANKNTTEKIITAPDPSPQLVANALNDISTDVPTALAGLSNTATDATFTAGTDQVITALAQNTTDQGSLALTGNNKTRTGQLTFYAAVGLAKDTNTVATLGIPIASPGS